MAVMLKTWIMVLLVLFLIVSIIWDHRRRRRDRSGTREWNVIAGAARVASVGLMWGVFASLAVLQFDCWEYVVIGLLLGGTPGILLGKGECNKWEKELRAHGCLLPRVGQTMMLQSWLIVLGCAVIAGLVICVAFAIPAVQSALLSPTFVTLGLSGSAAFFLAWGTYTWVWGKRKERQGFKPLVVLTRTASKN
jgi:hypothetical protein